jgi:hypothetical protein
MRDVTVTVSMDRIRSGAYAMGDYLIRYSAWLGVDWDGPRESYRPWHVYRRASHIDNRMHLEALATLAEAEAYVLAQIAGDAAGHSK